jgi:hypothetical protein
LGSQCGPTKKTKRSKTGPRGERGREHPLFGSGGRGREHPLFVGGGEGERRRGADCDGGQMGAKGVPAVKPTREAPVVVLEVQAGVWVVELEEALPVGG